MSQDHILPSTGFLRIWQVLIFIPICESQLWEEVKRGLFPAPLKLSKGVTVWIVEDIREYIERKKLEKTTK